LKKQRKKQKEWRVLGGEGFGGFGFLHNTKSPKCGGTQKLHQRRILEGFEGL